MENGVERRENLRSFVAWASGVGGGGLSSLLRIVDNALDSGAPIGAAPPVLPRGAVSIMTVHRSKGLEFPVVILADCARKFNLRDTSDPVLFHPQLGVGMALRGEEGGGLYSTASHRAIRMAQRAEAVSEEMRILYVALTRARDKLVVTFPLQNPEKTLSELAVALEGMGGATPYLLGQASSFSEWLCAFGLLHPGGEALRKLAGGATLPLLQAEGSLHAQVVPVYGVSAQPEAHAAFVRTALPDEALLKKLQENFAAQYAGAALCTLPLKVSVSSLAHKGESDVLARPAFMYSEGFTAAERGTALHSVLQFADLDAARADLHAEVGRLVAQGYIRQTVADQLDTERMKRFLSSPVAQRMHEADTVLREYDFFNEVPAQTVQPDIDPAFAQRPVMVQGIADVILLNGDTAEIVDYKTDRGKTPRQFLEAYTAQLALYRDAVEKCLGVTVTRCTLYAFSLNCEIDVPVCCGAVKV
jgi:ATP-dependent helicase/nuclease subunit A